MVRPLFNVFPSDVSVRNNADQFFWGDAIMVAPVLNEGAVTKDVYFPEVCSNCSSWHFSFIFCFFLFPIIFITRQ